MCHAADTYSSIEQVRPALEVIIANIIKGNTENKSSIILGVNQSIYVIDL